MLIGRFEVQIVREGVLADISSIEKQGRRDVEGIFRNSFSEWRKSHLILCTQHITDKFLCPEGDAMAIL